ncbi:MAG: serine/threonine-protein kinase, partial [Nanoarchaeota archaeon]
MEVPKVLDNKYENLEQLGEGAFGVVYKARSLESNRLYAIKYAKDDDAVKALAKEENLETRLNHQNIVKVYEANLRNSLPYIVMGYIEGESLEERLGKGTISQNESLMIVKQVLNALSYAHSQNVVHGDIKPSNILIS